MQQDQTPSPEELVRLFYDSVETKTNYNYAVLPYIKVLTEPLKLTNFKTLWHSSNHETSSHIRANIPFD
jgi:hypothetical protein